LCAHARSYGSETEQVVSTLCTVEMVKKVKQLKKGGQLPSAPPVSTVRACYSLVMPDLQKLRVKSVSKGVIMRRLAIKHTVHCKSAEPYVDASGVLHNWGATKTHIESKDLDMGISFIVTLMD
jgi:hypothetical protein